MARFLGAVLLLGSLSSGTPVEGMVRNLVPAEGSVGAVSVISGMGGNAGPIGPIGVVAVPLEDRLSAGTTGFLRTLSKWYRQMTKVMTTAALRWRSWLGGALIFAAFAVVAPVTDRALIDVWRREGIRAFLRSLASGVAVYVRLLRDSRAPAVGKALLAFAVVYGVSGRDLMPDRAGVIEGLADDFLLLILVSRGFMRMCPDDLVEEHAVRVAAARAA